MRHSFFLQKSQLQNRCPKDITYGLFLCIIRFLNAEESVFRKSKYDFF